jgi:hypothetical protein
MENEKAMATTNPTDARPIRVTRSWADEPAAVASSEASATLLAAAKTEPDTTQQTQTPETPAEKTAETVVADSAKPVTETAVGAPEKYEFKAPEGTAFDPGILETFSTAAKAANLTQDAAQKLIETMSPALAARQVEQVKAIHEEWRSASSTDKEFGGDKLQENLGVARKAYESFATPELRKLLDDTGMGNHPEVIRLMYRIGKKISEDKFVGGKAANPAAANPANILYDKTAQKG